MGQADIVTKEYMREPHVFADAFNFLLYDGRQVIKPSELKELDTAEMMYIFGGGIPKEGDGRAEVSGYFEICYGYEWSEGCLHSFGSREPNRYSLCYAGKKYGL